MLRQHQRVRSQDLDMGRGSLVYHGFVLFARMKEDLESRLNAIDTGHAKHSSMFSEEARLWGRGKTVDPHESDFELVSAKGGMSCSFLQPPSFTNTSTAWAK